MIFSHRFLYSDFINFKTVCIPGCLLIHLNIIIQHRHQSSTIFINWSSTKTTMLNNVFNNLAYIFLLKLMVESSMKLGMMPMQQDMVRNYNRSFLPLKVPNPVNSTIGVQDQFGVFLFFFLGGGEQGCHFSGKILNSGPDHFKFQAQRSNSLHKSGTVTQFSGPRVEACWHPWGEGGGGGGELTSLAWIFLHCLPEKFFCPKMAF